MTVMGLFANSLSREPETSKVEGGREKRLKSFISITSFFSLFYVTVSYLIGFYMGIYVMFGNFLFFALLLLLFMKRQWGYRLIANLYILNCILAILMCSYFSGGVNSPVLPWFVLIPVCSLLLLSTSRDSTLWLLVISLIFMGYGFMNYFGHGFPVLYNQSWADFFFIACFAGLGLIVFIVTMVFEVSKEKAYSEIFEKNKLIESQKAELMANTESLKEANAVISSNNEVLSKQKEEILLQRDALNEEKEKSDKLLLNILPESIALELKVKGSATPRLYNTVNVLFTDFVNFTNLAEQLSPEALIDELNTYIISFDNIIQKFGIEKIKTIGDAYMAAGGLTVASHDAVKQTVFAALEMQDFVIKRKAQKAALGQAALEMRVGIHTGPVVAGIVGVKKFQYDIWGDAVNTAARMEQNGEVGKVNVSHSTYELLKDDVRFTLISRGKLLVKGKGEVEMWFVELNKNVT